MGQIPLALTYDDVLLIPQFSSIRSRHDVSTATKFTNQITLNTPFISANMDTVTGGRMSIAMAEFGGIGVLHRFQPIQNEVSEVAMVKRYQSEVVEVPHTVSPDVTLSEANQTMSRLGVSGLPVVDEYNKLVGILSRRDVQLVSDKMLVSDRMTPLERLLTAPQDVTLEQARHMLSQSRLEKLPLVDEEGRLVGLITAKDLSKRSGAEHASRDSKGRLRVVAAVGVVGDFLKRAQALVEAGADALVIDIAHGNSVLMLSAIRQLRELLGDVPLVAGNVAGGEATKRLIEAGVDAIKVGVGPGALCTTRQVAGVGVPQFTALLQSAEVAHKYGIPIVADGGIRYSGDVAKAIGAGASTVMLGSLLAGTDESPGVVIMREGRRIKMARGSASAEAAIDRAIRDDPILRWTTSDVVNTDAAPEGIQSPVPYRGPVREVLGQFCAGLRSAMSYCDATTIEQMWQNAQFVQQTQAGLREARPHALDRF